MLNKSVEEIDQLQKALEIKSQHIDNLLYTIVHDLMNPTESIIALTHLAQEKNSTGSSTIEVIKRIEKSSMRMKSLIESILEYGRLGNSDFPIQKISVDPIVDEVIESLKVTAKAIFQINICDQLPQLWTNEILFYRAFENLLSNSIKYGLTANSQLIEVGVDSSKKNYVGIYVKDFGDGISPNYHEDLFRVFKQFTYKKLPGSGLGLAIVERIMSSQGGHCEVTSQAGEGATFTIFFPENFQETIC